MAIPATMYQFSTNNGWMCFCHSVGSGGRLGSAGVAVGATLLAAGLTNPGGPTGSGGGRTCRGLAPTLPALSRMGGNLPPEPGAARLSNTGCSLIGAHRAHD